MRPVRTPPVQYDVFPLKGGLDLVSPTLSVAPGTAREALNFEVSLNGGYSRIEGYERFDGRPGPSAATYGVVIAALTSPVLAGSTISNGAGASGVVISVSGSAVYFTKAVGAFSVGNTLTVSGSPVGTVTDTTPPSSTAEEREVLRSLAADVYRADIGQVPGSGPVRGVAWLDGTLYAWRDNDPPPVVVETDATWSSGLANGTWTLTNSNRTAELATSGGGVNNIQSATTAASGKRYLEIVWDTSDVYGSGIRHDVGITRSSPPSSGGSGEINGIGYRRSGNIMVGGVSVLTTSALSNGDVVGIAIDTATGRVWVSRNGVWVTGNPATDTSPVATIATGTYFPFASVESGAALKTTIRSKASQFSYSAPAGFTSWGFVSSSPGGTADALNIYKATTSGWVQVPYGFELAFNAGTGTAIAAGDTVSNLAGTATGVVAAVALESGLTWAGGSGRLILSSTTGTWAAADQIRVSGSQRATALGAATAIKPLPGGRVETATASLGGNLTAPKLYGCDGVNRGFQFDGTTYAPIRITGLSAAADKPQHVAVHKNFLFFSVANSVQNSAIAAPFVWSAVLGANEIATEEEITGLQSLPSTETAALLITSKNNTQVLYGNAPAAFQLAVFDRGNGAAHWTVQSMRDAYMLDDKGVLALATSQAYGNFDVAALTFPIRPFVEARTGTALASGLHRSKSQYRVFYNDGHGIYITIVNGRFMGAMPVWFPKPVNCWCEADTAYGQTLSFFGSATDGYVYQMDTGPDFDGDGVPAFLTLNFNPQGNSRVLKRYRRAALEMSGVGFARLDVGYRLGYDSVAINQAGAGDYRLSLRGVFWDSFTWDAFTWDERPLAPLEVACNGTAENVALTIACDSRLTHPFTVNSATFHYSVRRGIR